MGLGFEAMAVKEPPLFISADPSMEKSERGVPSEHSPQSVPQKFQEVGDIFRMILDSCKDAVGFSAGYVALLSPDGLENEVVHLDSGGLPCLVDPSLPMPVRGLRQKAYEKGEAVFENRFALSPWAAFMPEGHATLDNVLFAPLVAEDRVIGLLGMANKPGGFTEADAKVASGFGRMAAAALVYSRTASRLKQAETGLLESNRRLTESLDRYRAAIEHSNDGVVISKGTVQVYANRQFARMFGYADPQELIGQPVTMRVHPDDSLMVAERSLARQRGDPVPSKYEFRGLTKQGKLLYVEVSAARITLEGEPASLAYFRDVTDRKWAEAELRRTLVLNQKLVDALPCIAFLVEEGKIATANERARKAGAELGAPCFSVWGEEAGPCPWCLAEKALVAQGPRRTEQEALGRVWDIHWIPVSGTSYLHYAFDVTEKRREEARFQQVQKMEALGTLAGGIAHDFNNILSAILGYGEMISRFEIPEDSPAQESLGQILSASHRAKDLVKRILAFSRQSSVEKINLDVRPLLRESVMFLSSSLPATVEIRQSIDPDAGTIHADPTQIQQVIMNLVANAAHAMEKDGGTLEISLAPGNLSAEEVRAEEGLQEGPHVRLSVADTGHGIDPAVLDRIFEPFFTTKEADKGTGLGLYVVHGIVREHGGMIRVDSAPGKGSAFHVFFPAVEAGPKEEAAAPETLPKGRERILFVDDEPSLARLGKLALERLGYRVETMTSAREALEAFRRDPDSFDLVITDTTMPGMRGEVLVDRLRNIHPGIPVIICSGFNERLDEEKALAIGASAFVLKPLNLNDLARVVRNTLDSFRK